MTVNSFLKSNHSDSTLGISDPVRSGGNAKPSLFFHNNKPYGDGDKMTMFASNPQQGCTATLEKHDTLPHQQPCLQILADKKVGVTFQFPKLLKVLVGAAPSHIRTANNENSL